MPGEHDRLIGLDKIDKVINITQAPIGRNLHNHMLEVLRERYGPRLAAVQIDLVPRESLNVMTTWALDGNSLRSLKEESFRKRWEARTCSHGSRRCSMAS